MLDAVRAFRRLDAPPYTSGSGRGEKSRVRVGERSWDRPDHPDTTTSICAALTGCIRVTEASAERGATTNTKRARVVNPPCGPSRKQGRSFGASRATSHARPLLTRPPVNLGALWSPYRPSLSKFYERTRAIRCVGRARLAWGRLVTPQSTRGPATLRLLTSQHVKLHAGDVNRSPDRRGGEGNNARCTPTTVGVRIGHRGHIGRGATNTTTGRANSGKRGRPARH